MSAVRLTITGFLKPAILATALMAGICSSAIAESEFESAYARGKTIAQKNCERCHAIGISGPSKLNLAPPFRVLHKRYDVRLLEEALAEGLVTGHPDMPEFTFTPVEINALLTYMESLETAK